MGPELVEEAGEQRDPLLLGTEELTEDLAAAVWNSVGEDKRQLSSDFAQSGRRKTNAANTAASDETEGLAAGMALAKTRLQERKLKQSEQERDARALRPELLGQAHKFYGPDEEVPPVLFEFGEDEEVHDAVVESVVPLDQLSDDELFEAMRAAGRGKQTSDVGHVATVDKGNVTDAVVQVDRGIAALTFATDIASIAQQPPWRRGLDLPSYI